uniref:hypothetical protein n=1 Tax=Ndongobacter massiliensis TaxID=1871025 RepID=UPI000930B308|nr:hypothetical protein [Ndongobacter massiliensis]
MNETLQSLLQIDRDTEKLRADTEILIEQERAHAQEVLAHFMQESEARAKRDAEARTRNIQEQTKSTINALQDASDQEIAQLRAFFDAKKDAFVEQAFRKLRS